MELIIDELGISISGILHFGQNINNEKLELLKKIDRSDETKNKKQEPIKLGNKSRAFLRMTDRFVYWKQDLVIDQTLAWNE